MPENMQSSVLQKTAQIQRPARVLIGWMSEQEAALWLASRRTDRQNLPEFQERGRLAIASVASRNPGLDQSRALQPPPSEMLDYFSTWSTNPATAQFVAEGWQIAIADLSQIIAIQPLVFTDEAIERVSGINPSDLSSLASITLPVPKPSELMAHFDGAQQTWVFSSSNPNLRIFGQFQAEVQPGMLGFGFMVGIPPSFMQIAEFQGRYLLRDGYHRAYGLLKAGITQVPVIHRTFPSSTELALPAGLFALDILLGNRPPLLSDFLNNDVSSSIMMPAAQRIVVIQGLQFGAIG